MIQVYLFIVVLKKIKEVTPADPFEAELLLMAGMVADEPKIDNNLLSESEDDMSNDGNKTYFLFFKFLCE